MCGRYGLFTPPDPLVRRLGGRIPATYAFVAHYNVAPTQAVLALRNDPTRTFGDVRWGLVANAPGERRLSTINARIETLSTSPLYGPLLIGNRCAIFADGYYEWRVRSDGSKQPFWIARRDRATFAFAGLWAPDPAAAGRAACTIVTQPANAVLAPLHERMPVVLDTLRAEHWLAAHDLDPGEARTLLAPDDGSAWTYHPVGRAVGNVANDDPTLIVAVDEPAQQPSLFDLTRPGVAPRPADDRPPRRR